MRLAKERAWHCRVALATALGVAGGCHAIFPYHNSGVGADAQPAADDARAVPDARREDGARPDAARPTLAAICPLQADDDTVGLFDFAVAGGQFANLAAAGHEGFVVGALPAAMLPVCPGGGLVFAAPVFAPERCADCSAPGTLRACLAAGYAWIPSWPAIESLDEGSLDFWVRLDEATPTRKHFVISRDAEGTTTNGHLSVWRDGDALVLRLQRMGQSPEPQSCVCSDPATSRVADQAWHHVGINFGRAGLELYVDGARQRATGVVNELCKCADGAAITNGIDGNQQPIIVGAAAINACEGARGPVTEPMIGAVGNLRVSRVRRSFATLPLSPPLSPTADRCCVGDGNTCGSPPSTPGCEMTFPGGYCDPNGDASYADGDWQRGWYACH
jgi:hypothetical protein